MSRLIHVRAAPSASRNAVEPLDETDCFKVYVTAPPDKGKANKAIIKLVAKELGIPKSKLVIVRGETHRDKVFEIQT